jgi:hypothetical protein
VNPPTFSVVLEECVLRRPVGGQTVMREQLRRLLEIADMPTVTLQVLPMTVGEHMGMNGPFTVYHFDNPDDPNVVYIEHPREDLYLENSEHVDPYIIAFDLLRASALSPERSVTFIKALARKLERDLQTAIVSP